MPINDLEQALKDLPKIGTLVKDRGYRQVWRFQHAGQAYYLKFYPRRGSWWKRLIRGNPAMREFTRLQWLQKAQVPAPRAVAVLMGFHLNNQIGDAVILEAIEPSIQLDQFIQDLQMRGQPIPHRRQLTGKLLDLIARLANAGLGHSDLHLGNILLHNDQLYLLDGYAVRKGGLSNNDLLILGHSVRSFASRTDLIRGWMLLGAGPLPLQNPMEARQFRKVVERAHDENPYFGRLNLNGYAGLFFKHSKYPRRWSQASQRSITREEWDRAWPELLQQIESDQLTVLKRSRSGDVLAGELTLGGRPLQVIVKRPFRRYWYRYINEIGRGSRARRAWRKSWNMIARDLPSAWPLLLMEKRTLGYVTDAVIVFEKIPGPTLADADLDALGPDARDLLFRRTGRILRRIELLGFSHFDAKASNWIVLGDENLGPMPILIDIDGIRRRQWIALGIERLLRSMREHPQYTPPDSYSLCKGYAPFAFLQQEDEPTETPRHGEEPTDE